MSPWAKEVRALVTQCHMVTARQSLAPQRVRWHLEWVV